MRTRGVVLLGATALLSAACSQPEPQYFSEAPRPASSQTVDPSAPTDPQDQPGRFVARCATEAEGNGTPGATIFTDGSEGVTDHCLRRYYIGVQPAPGAVYVPDDQTGFHAPTRESEGAGNSTWTPAQPRTDLGGATSQTSEPARTGEPQGEGRETTGPAQPSQPGQPSTDTDGTSVPSTGGESPGTSSPSNPGGTPEPSGPGTNQPGAGSAETGTIPSTPTPTPGTGSGSGSGSGTGSVPPPPDHASTSVPTVTVLAPEPTFRSNPVTSVASTSSPAVGTSATP